MPTGRGAQACAGPWTSTPRSKPADLALGTRRPRPLHPQGSPRPCCPWPCPNWYRRHLRLNVTANTGRLATPFSEVEARLP
ncbi:hypothetical protein ABZ281_24505 [Streptomyces sp. NPDC006265]|uniref:hypothetical protein n=1 Tax=Streptomyces sp. NPDC006265 TaxID=3156740 RepID=UPI0033A1851D